MKTTQNQRIIEFLQEGGRLTSIDALSLFGTARLAARIHDLRKEGYNIDRDMVEVETRNGKAYVAEYSIANALAYHTL